MTDGFLPEFKIMPAKGGGYLALYRLFEGKPFVIIPGGARESATKALNAAKEYVRAKLNPPIRCEKAEPTAALGVADWHEQRAARQAEQQEQALGGVIVKGRTVVVERRRAL